MDLVIAAGPGVPHGLVVPGSVLVERFSRSSGPGGQGVNTADSRVEVELPLAALEPLLSPAQQRRLQTGLGDRVVGDRLVVTAQEHRQQRRNRVAARERLAEMLREALAPPPPSRRPTKPTRGSTERRIEAKKQRAQTKATRARPAPDA